MIRISIENQEPRIDEAGMHEKVKAKKEQVGANKCSTEK